MANTILHKRNSTASATPAANLLTAGELAINTADGRLFTKNSAGTVINLPVTSISGAAISPNAVTCDSVSSASGNIIIVMDDNQILIQDYGNNTITLYDGSVFAKSFVKDGGTSSQFLKADGSVDSTSYSNASNLSSGTLSNARLPTGNKLSGYCAGIFFG